MKKFAMRGARSQDCIHSALPQNWLTLYLELHAFGLLLIVEKREHVVALQFAPSLEKIQLDDKPQSHDFRS
jgi:hypothetical protein